MWTGKTLLPLLWGYRNLIVSKFSLKITSWFEFSPITISLPYLVSTSYPSNISYSFYYYNWIYQVHLFLCYIYNYPNYIYLYFCLIFLVHIHQRNYWYIIISCFLKFAVIFIKLIFKINSLSFSFLYKSQFTLKLSLEGTFSSIWFKL